MRSLNYSNDIIPSELASAYFIKSSQMSSESYLLAPRTFLSYKTEIYPLPSSSNISNIFFMFDSVIRKILFVAIVMKWEKVILSLLNLLKTNWVKNLAFS
jgi:hypothetical protein